MFKYFVNVLVKLICISVDYNVFELKDMVMKCKCLILKNDCIFSGKSKLLGCESVTIIFANV